MSGVTILGKQDIDQVLRMLIKLPADPKFADDKKSGVHSALAKFILERVSFWILFLEEFTL